MTTGPPGQYFEQIFRMMLAAELRRGKALVVNSDYMQSVPQPPAPEMRVLKSRAPASAPVPQQQPQKKEEGSIMAKEETHLDEYDNDPTDISKTKAPKVEIIRTGDIISIPSNLSVKEALAALTLKAREEEQVMTYNIDFDAHPHEGAVAFCEALSETFGWATLVPTPGFFGDSPPGMLSVEVDVGKKINVPWGEMNIPEMKGHLVPQFSIKDREVVFCLHVCCKKKDQHRVELLAERTREVLRKKSIYRGKAIAVNLKALDPRQDQPMDHAPTFIDVSKVKSEELILSRDVEQIVSASLFTPIRQTKRCRELGIPLKRGVLLEGTYGTGKTLTAQVASKLCIENGWTFIYVTEIDDFSKALRFAKRYQPALVFAEDIDRASNDREADDNFNHVLNTIDGVDMKNTEIMVVLTTNFVEQIDKAMLRPGRLDAVISITAPDAEAVQRLLHLYGRNIIQDGANLSQVGKRLAGQIPAVVREVVERAKLASVDAGRDNLSEQDLLVAANGMMMHMQLLNEKKQVKMSEREKAAHILAGAIRHEEKGNGKSSAVAASATFDSSMD